MKKNVLVIGGSGFLGSYVADYLSQKGYNTTVFDIKDSPWLKNDQKFIKGSIEEFRVIEKAIEGSDFVYNFAALTDLNEAIEKPLKTLNVNVVGNVNVMEACRKHNVKRFIYASSVYVQSREGGFYRCSKQAAESYVEEFQKTFGLEYTILRYGSLYGPRSDDTNGIFRIIKNAIETGKLKYQGHPEAMREYIHVEDAAQASIAALDETYINKSIILTGQEQMKVIDVIKMIGEILDLPEDRVDFSEVHYTGHYIRTPYSYQPNIGKKYTLPVHIDLGQGLLQLINELKNRN
tara:strand:- start:23216 stop:24091 length:876 start_codon:yes stop_codon:yes gene_type:complete